MDLSVKWQGKEFKVQLQAADTVETLKHRLEQDTKVQVKRQKLLGLKTKDGKLAQVGKWAPDTVCVNARLTIRQCPAIIQIIWQFWFAFCIKAVCQALCRALIAFQAPTCSPLIPNI